MLPEHFGGAADAAGAAVDAVAGGKVVAPELTEELVVAEEVVVVGVTDEGVVFDSAAEEVLAVPVRG